jgi:hypothetical protein
MKILIFSLFVLVVVSEWSMKQNNLQRTGLEDDVEGPDSALNVSSQLRITFEEIEKKCPANEGQKYDKEVYMASHTIGFIGMDHWSIVEEIVGMVMIY